MFQDLLSKKLIFISGKGGVGKTTLSAALALKLSESGRHVLLAEIDGQNQLSQLLGSPPTTYKIQNIAPLLDVINITPRESFHEYVLMQIKFEAIYKAVFDNKYVKAFIEGAPGLAELMSMGKVYAMLSAYDTVIVDAPATGHGMSLLQIPSIVAKAVRVGPLQTHSKNIENLLGDATRTASVVVTLPEEMPVTETLELQSWLNANLHISLHSVFLNAFYPPLLNKTEASATEQFLQKQNSDLHGVKQSYQLYQSRAQLHAKYREVLNTELPTIPIVTIPNYFTAQLGLDEIRQIGDHIAAA